MGCFGPRRTPSRPGATPRTGSRSPSPKCYAATGRTLVSGRSFFATSGGGGSTPTRSARRTREEYDSLWRLHLEPFLGERQLSHITTETVRRWRTRLLRDGRPEDRAAEAYSLLRAMMNTAVDDELIKRNPCRVKGAGQHRTPERPVATVPQVFALADAMPVRFRALILSATFTGLLGRTHRSAASRRAAGRPRPRGSVDDSYAEPGPDGLLFTGERGGPLRRGNFHRATKWTRTVVGVGLPAGFHFHDLRHTGNQLVAAAGASTRELMHRMGHGSMRAALIYQHATSQRDRVLADGLSNLVKTARGTSSEAHEEATREPQVAPEEDR